MQKQQSGFSFLDISSLNLPESVKDECRIASLHGINIIVEANRYKTKPEQVREIRLLSQYKGYDNMKKYFHLPTEVLRILRVYAEAGLSFDELLNKYMTKTNRLKVTTEVFEKIAKANITENNLHIDFSKVRNDLVDIILFANNKKIKTEDIIAYSNETVDGNYKRVEVIKLLVTLRVADINIEPFLKDIWDEDRIFTLIQGSLIIQPDEAIKRYDLTPSFTAGEIEQIIKAHAMKPELAELLSLTEDEIPIYNQYQAHEINEGYRLGLDISEYFDPNYSDLEMRQIREKLMKREEKKKGRKFRENLLRKVHTRLSDIRTDWDSFDK